MRRRRGENLLLLILLPPSLHHLLLLILPPPPPRQLLLLPPPPPPSSLLLPLPSPPSSSSSSARGGRAFDEMLWLARWATGWADPGLRAAGVARGATACGKGCCSDTLGWRRHGVARRSRNLRAPALPLRSPSLGISGSFRLTDKSFASWDVGVVGAGHAASLQRMPE